LSEHAVRMKQYRRLSLALISLAMVFCLLAIKFDLFARAVSFMLAMTLPLHGHLDEYLSLILLLSLGYAAMAWRRYWELALECAKRKDAEEALRESEERFRLVFDQSTEGIVLAEPGSGKILYVNQTMEKMLGYARQDLLDAGAALLYRHFAAQNLERIFSEIALTRDVLALGVKTRDRAGSARVVSLRVKSVEICGNGLAHFSLRDMTEKARYEEQTRQAQAKLIHANKMSSLGLLVSGVAHEINNPNSFIMFNSSMLAEIWQDADRVLDGYHRGGAQFALGGLPYPEIGEATKRLIDGICEGAQRIKTTVDNLKDFARQDVSGLNRPLDLNQAVLKAVSILTPQIKKHCEDFRLNLEECLPETSGNPQQIEQVVMNLLLNALQSLPNRQCTVSIATSLSAEGCLLATISDQGIGMDQETMSRLSEPFFTTKSDSAGTGLGLYISQSIVKEHGGRLLFESEPGKGTSAVIELQQRPPEATA
jgi:PAS domain S-box-containing protein